MANSTFIEKIRTNGITWKGFAKEIEEYLHPTLIGREEIAFGLVKRALTEIFGEHNRDTQMRPKKNSEANTRWIFVR